MSGRLAVGFVLLAVAGTVVGVLAAGPAAASAPRQTADGATYTISTQSIDLHPGGTICARKVAPDVNRVAVNDATMNGIDLYLGEGDRPKHVASPSADVDHIVLYTNGKNTLVDLLAVTGTCIPLDQPQQTVLQVYYSKSDTLAMNGFQMDSVSNDTVPAPGGFNLPADVLNNSSSTGNVTGTVNRTVSSVSGATGTVGNTTGTATGLATRLSDPRRTVTGTRRTLSTPTGPVERPTGAVGTATGTIRRTIGTPPSVGGTTAGARNTVTDATNRATGAVGSTTSTVTKTTDGATSTVDSTTSTVTKTTDSATSTVDSTTSTVSNTTDGTGAVDDTTDTVSNTTDGTTNTVDDTTNTVSNTTNDTTNTIANTTDSTTNTVDGTVQSVTGATTTTSTATATDTATTTDTPSTTTATTTTVETTASNAAPTAAFGLPDGVPTVGRPATLDAGKSTDSDGSISTYQWDFDGDGTYDATGKSVDHTFSTAGMRTVTMRVTDDDGATDAVTKTVDVNAPPSASFSVLSDVLEVGSPVTLDGTTSSDPDGTITKYQWDFDDDGTYDATGATPTPTFSSIGTHTVRLRVTDDNGATDTVSKDLDLTDGSSLLGGSNDSTTTSTSTTTSSGGTTTTSDGGLLG